MLQHGSRTTFGLLSTIAFLRKMGKQIQHIVSDCLRRQTKVVFTLYRIRMVTISNSPYERRFNFKSGKLFEQAGVTNVSSYSRDHAEPVQCKRSKGFHAFLITDRLIPRCFTRRIHLVDTFQFKPRF